MGAVGERVSINADAEIVESRDATSGYIKPQMIADDRKKKDLSRP